MALLQISYIVFRKSILKIGWYLMKYRHDVSFFDSQHVHFINRNKIRITGNASWSCSLADFRACENFFNEGLNETFFIAAIYSGNPSLAETDGAISSTISFSTKFGYSHKVQTISVKKSVISYTVINRPIDYTILHNLTQGLSNMRKAVTYNSSYTRRNLPIINFLHFSENVVHVLITTVKMQYTL